MPHEADTIVLIHGLWMTSESWEPWADRYRSAGHPVVNESWPGMDLPVAELRRDPSPIARLGSARIVAHYEQIIRALDRPPIIMGHSFGGAFTQVLLDRGLGAAGVAIHSAAVKGVTKLPFSTLRTGWPILRNPRNRHKAVAISVEQFRYRFTNHLTVEESAVPYERYCVPGAGAVLFEGAMANFRRNPVTRVDFGNADRAPLLFIAGGIDHVSPPSVNRSNAEKYRTAGTSVDYREFEGRSHFTLGQDGWEAVADHALEWALEHAAPAGARHPA